MQLIIQHHAISAWIKLLLIQIISLFLIIEMVIMMVFFLDINSSEKIKYEVNTSDVLYDTVL